MSIDPQRSKTTFQFLVLAFVVVPLLVAGIIVMRPPLIFDALAGVVGVGTQIRLVRWYRGTIAKWDAEDQKEEPDDNPSDWWR
jgi:hypothetical protein